MRIEDLNLTQSMEPWVADAIANPSFVGSGSFALVLDSAEGCVVKLTKSEVDYNALIYFTGRNIHFPKVIKYAANQAEVHGDYLHALLLEKLPNIAPLAAAPVADYINRVSLYKHNPLGLKLAAYEMRSGLLKDCNYPQSLSDALDLLGDYGSERMLKVELNQRLNWGERSDGTLVMFDLVHTTSEM